MMDGIMMPWLEKIVQQNRGMVESVAPRLATQYLLRQHRLSVLDLQFQTIYANSYALISEKNSTYFQKVMRAMKSYIGAGPIGPNKYWEYPWIMANLKLDTDMSVLDAGCGTAALQYVLAHAGVRMHGIDPHENVGWHGIDRTLAARFGCSIEYRREGIENISYADNTFDRVVCASVIEHCRATPVKNEAVTPQTDADRALQRRMMEEMVRVLKPGGLLVLTTDLNIPRSNSLLQSNVNVQNLLGTPGVKMVGERCAERFYGEEGFSLEAVVAQGDIDISNYQDALQTSLGITLQKIA
ncbi:MAG: class I SAM-dependent methyltransferase [Candidatus Andersenbacteria bacterium]